MDGPQFGAVLVPVWTEHSVLRLGSLLKILLDRSAYRKWADQLAAFQMDNRV